MLIILSQKLFNITYVYIFPRKSSLSVNLTHPTSGYHANFTTDCDFIWTHTPKNITSDGNTFWDLHYYPYHNNTNNKTIHCNVIAAYLIANIEYK